MAGVSEANGQWPLPYLEAAALGYIDGASTNLKFGYNSEVGTTELTIINGGTTVYAYPSAATVMQVSSTATTDTGTGTIVAGEGQSLQAVYTVPSGYTGLVNYMAVTAGRTTATGFITWRMVSRQQGEPFRSRNKFDTAAAGGEVEIQYIYSPIVLPSGTDVEVRAVGTVSNNACSAHVSITLVPTV